MDSSEFISVEQVYSDLITLVADEDFSKSGLDKGFYISRIHDAVTYFSLETFYQIVTDDIDNALIGSSGIVGVPINCFNIREIYLYNSGKCNKPSDYEVVHWKRNLATGSSGLKTARIKPRNRDRVLSGRDNGLAPGNNFVNTNNLYYANVQSGKIVLSDNCEENFNSIRLIYNGMGSKNGQLPCIPRILKDGIFEKAALDTFFFLKVRDKAYRVDYLDMYAKFHGTGRDKGTLRECKNRILSMNNFQRNDLNEYLSNADFI